MGHPTAPSAPKSTFAICDTGYMPTVEETSPKSVKVNVTAGTGMDIDWKDGHHSHYSFQYLRDACPCALCNDDRVRENREPGQPRAIATGHAADVQIRSEAGGNRRSGQVRDPLHLERWSRARHLLMGISA